MDQNHKAVRDGSIYPPIYTTNSTIKVKQYETCFNSFQSNTHCLFNGSFGFVFHIARNYSSMKHQTFISSILFAMRLILEQRRSNLLIRTQQRNEGVKSLLLQWNVFHINIMRYIFVSNTKDIAALLTNDI